MAKEFDIYLNKQHNKDIYITKEINEDISLNKRLTECDIVIYSMPFREGLTATERLVFDENVEHYTLQKLLSIPSGYKLVQAINNILETCNERLSLQTPLNAEATIQIHHVPELSQTNIVIGAVNTSNLAEAFARVLSDTAVEVSPVALAVAKPAGEGTSAVEPGVDNFGTVKQGNLSPSPATTIAADVIASEKQATLNIESGINPSAEVANLCFIQYRSASTGVVVSADDLRADIYIPAGSGNNTVYISESVAGALAQKCETFNNGIKTLIAITDTIIRSVAPEGIGVTMNAQVTPLLKRLSLLSEIDTNTLGSYDAQTLEDVDYIII